MSEELIRNPEDHPGGQIYPVRTVADHEECPGFVRTKLAALGCDVTVSDVPPVVRGPYTLAAPFICPHGTRYWAEPTGEQIAQWVRDGVE